MAGKQQIDFWSRACVEGLIAYLLLPCGRVAIVDREDLPKCSHYLWQSTKRRKIHYAVGRLRPSRGRVSWVYLHRLVMGEPAGKLIDHKDFDGMNNRKRNLRRCVPSHSVAHTRRRLGRTGFRGVAFHEKARKYQAMFRHKHIGLYNTAEEAARAYDAAAKEYFGEFAVLNVPRRSD